jgi:DNA repair protein RecO (recombination protein O)
MVSGRMRGYKTEAVVLRYTPTGEADRIVVLHTPEYGKVRAVAKGVRRSTSKLAGHLELLNRVSVSLAEGRGIDTVTEAETVQVYRGLRGDLELLSAGMFMAELVDSISVERAASQPTYALLTASLERLETAERPGQEARYFQVRMLALSGFGPELHRCVQCDAELEPRDHTFTVVGGGIVCPTCRVGSQDVLMPVSLNTLKVLRFFQREPAEKAMALRLDDRLLDDLGQVLDGYARYVLERDLKTTEFMDLVRPDKTVSHGRGSGSRKTT